MYSVKEYIAGEGFKETLISRECGDLTPGPLVTDADTYRAKAIFISDPRQPNENPDLDARAGFKAKYEFLESIDKGKPGNSITPIIIIVIS